MSTLPAGLTPGGRFDAWVQAVVAYVALDVDGTLVGALDTVRPDAVEAIAAVRGRGIPVGYATGRMQAALDDIDAQIGLPGPHVVHNGAVVRRDGATAASWPLLDDEVATLLAIAANHDAYCELYLDEGYLVTARDERARAHWELLGEEPLGTADQLGGRPVTKATYIAFEHGHRDVLIRALEDAGLAAGPAESLLTPNWTYVNATRAGVDKGAALATAAELAGTDLAHTLVIGDGGNDIPMLRVAGTAVAMGQAGDAAKAAAHLVTDHVDSGGLATALRALA